MSVALTEQAVRDRRKVVTRRLGWQFLRAGDRLTLCRKVQGRRRGEPLVRLAEVEVVDVRRVLLGAIDPTEVAREGFRNLTPMQFVEFFCTHMGCTPDDVVTRIEWRYLDDEVAEQVAAQLDQVNQRKGRG
jgi:hypothetical protein